jgi:hypothetical protein
MTGDYFTWSRLWRVYPIISHDWECFIIGGMRTTPFVDGDASCWWEVPQCRKTVSFHALSSQINPNISCFQVNPHHLMFWRFSGWKPSTYWGRTQFPAQSTHAVNSGSGCSPCEEHLTFQLGSSGMGGIFTQELREIGYSIVWKIQKLDGKNDVSIVFYSIELGIAVFFIELDVKWVPVMHWDYVPHYSHSEGCHQDC